MTPAQLELLRLRLVNSLTRAKVDLPVEVADIAMANLGQLLTEIAAEEDKRRAS